MSSTKKVQKENAQIQESIAGSQLIPFPRKKGFLKLEEELSKPRYRILLEILTLGFFALIVIAPVMNLVSNVLDNTGEIRRRLFEDSLMGNLGWQQIQSALWVSFSVAFIAVAVDIVIGFPIAVILARTDFRGKNVLNLLVDLPMAVPTSALGFSVMMFWALFGVSPGFLLIIFVHVAFTFPYIVRNLKISIEKIDSLLEDAARTLAASKLTVFRTISFPLLKEGLIAGAILSFTRSLGETGATMICAGLVETAPILVVGLRKQLQIPSASFLSLILILISVSLLLLIKFLANRSTARKDFWRVHYDWETFLSRHTFTAALKIISAVLMIVFVLIPSFYIFTQVNFPESQAELFGPDNKWAHLWMSITNSFQVGLIVVLLDLIFGIPFAFILVRAKWGKIINLLDTMLDIPLIIPSAALGFTIFLFWGPAGMNLAQSGTPMIIFVHMTFTFPYIVRPIAATIRKVDKGHEDASAIFGAAPLTTFRRITLPAIKNGIIAGLIAAFTRSLGETGATLIVMGGDRTVPVLIVDWVEENVWAAAALASVLVICLSTLFLILLRWISPDTQKSKL